MNWSDERYVKLFTRDTLTWQTWPWEARALFALLLRKVDGAGLIETGTMDQAQAVALQVNLPLAVVSVGLPALIDSGTVEVVEGGVCVVNFIRAQESTKTEARKKQDQRQRAQDLRRAQAIESLRGNVPQRPDLSPACPPPAQPSSPPAQLTTSSPPAQPTASPVGEGSAKKPKGAKRVKPQAELPGVVPPRPPSRIGRLWDEFQAQRAAKITCSAEDGGLDMPEVQPDEPPDWGKSAATLGQWLKLWPDLPPEQVDHRLAVLMTAWMENTYWASSMRDGQPAVIYPWGAFIAEKQWRRAFDELFPGAAADGGVH